MSTIDKIIDLLEISGKTQKQLTDWLDVDKSVFTAWKNGGNQSYNKYLPQIAEFFGVSIDYLFRETITLDVEPHEDDEYIIKCPLCEDESYSHFKRILDVNFSSKKSYGIAIELECEALHHKFYYVIETYKGNSYIMKLDEEDVRFLTEDNNKRKLILPFETIAKQNIDSFIKKYRTLDEYGKKAIDNLIDIEYERCSNAIATPKIITLPMAELKASAGTGQWLGDDEYTTRVNVLDTPEARKANVVVEVSGDSMLPDYKNGEKVLVRLSAEPVENEIGIFIIDNNGYIKKFGKDKLISLNKDYPDIPFKDDMNVRFVGKVVGKAELI